MIFFSTRFFSAPRVALTLESRIEDVLRIRVAGEKSLHVKVPLENTVKFVDTNAV